MLCFQHLVAVFFIAILAFIVILWVLRVLGRRILHCLYLGIRGVLSGMFTVILWVPRVLGRCILHCLGFRRRGVLRGMCSESMMDLFY